MIFFGEYVMDKILKFIESYEWVCDNGDGIVIIGIFEYV